MDGDHSLTLAEASPEDLGLLPDPHQEFLGKILTDLTDLSCKFNGATRYLKKNLPTVEAKAEFGKYLWDAFPEASDTFYHIESALPVVAESDMAATQPLTVHVACLGFLAEQSPKPEVELRNGYNFSCTRQALDELEASTGEGPPGLGSMLSSLFAVMFSFHFSIFMFDPWFGQPPDALESSGKNKNENDMVWRK